MGSLNKTNNKGARVKNSLKLSMIISQSVGRVGVQSRRTQILERQRQLILVICGYYGLEGHGEH